MLPLKPTLPSLPQGTRWAVIGPESQAECLRDTATLSSPRPGAALQGSEDRKEQHERKGGEEGKWSVKTDRRVFSFCSLARKKRSSIEPGATFAAVSARSTCVERNGGMALSSHRSRSSLHFPLASSLDE